MPSVVTCLLLGAAVLILVAWNWYDRGFTAGYEKALSQHEQFGKDCYKRGRVDADNWWLGIEADVLGERREIWKQENRR